MADGGLMNAGLAFHQYRRQRKAFSIRVYVVAVIFVIITIGLWTAFLHVSKIAEIFTKFYYIHIITLFVALLLATLFVFIEGLRLKRPVNFIVCILIVVLVTIGMSRLVFILSTFQFGFYIGIAAITTGLFVILGIVFPKDLTLHVVIVLVLSIIFFTGSVFFAVAAIFLIMYHAQTINGKRYAEMRTNDYVFAALIIYHDFVLIFILSILVASAIASTNLVTSINFYGSGSCLFCKSFTTTTRAAPEAPEAPETPKATEAPKSHAEPKTQPVPTVTTKTMLHLKPSPVPSVHKTTKKGRHFLLYNVYQPLSYEDYQRKNDLTKGK